MEESIRKITIDSDERAFNVLSEALNGNIDDNFVLELDNWPLISIKLQGDDFKGTMPTRIMHPILELQKEINKVYCRAKYGTDNTNKLTDEERENLELIIKVNEGSSEYVANFLNGMKEIIKASNMNGKEVVILAVALGSLYAAHSAWIGWLDHKEKTHSLDQTVRLSEQETELKKILAKAILSSNELQLAAEGAEKVRTEFAKRLKDSDTLLVNGEKVVDGSHASEIIRSLPVEPEDIRIDDIFVITDISFPQELGQPYKLSVKRVSDKLVLNVEASHANITEQQIDTIKTAGFGIKRVSLSINAKKKNDKISNAKLVTISLNINQN